MTRANDESNLAALHAILMPALARAAVGDFQTDLEISPENDERVNEILVGVQVLLDVINEKMTELARTQNGQSEPECSVTLIDEVLRTE